MSKCVNCGGKGEHEHHIVPKVKGGIFTVLLCIECHGKVHDRDMSSSYLTKLGMYKKSIHYLYFSYLFEWVIVRGYSIQDACNCHFYDFGEKLSSQKAKKYLKNMASLNPNDLMDLLDPIWEFSNAKFHTRERMIDWWVTYSPYPVNMEAKHA